MAIGRISIVVKPRRLNRAAAGRAVGKVADAANLYDVAAVAVSIPEALAAPVVRVGQPVEIIVNKPPGFHLDRRADLKQVARVVKLQRLIALNGPARSNY